MSLLVFVLFVNLLIEIIILTNSAFFFLNNSIIMRSYFRININYYSVARVNFGNTRVLLRIK